MLAKSIELFVFLRWKSFASIPAIILWLDLSHELLIAGASEMAWGRYKTHRVNVRKGSYSFQDSPFATGSGGKNQATITLHIYELPPGINKLRKETQRQGKSICGRVFVPLLLVSLLFCHCSFAWVFLFSCFWPGKPNAQIVSVSSYVNIKLCNQHFYVKSRNNNILFNVQ